MTEKIDGEMGEKRRQQLTKTRKRARCCSCGQPLATRGGFANTGLCGPCCTGDASARTEEA